MRFTEWVEKTFVDSEIREESGSYVVQCPAHDDGNPSLVLSVGEKHGKHKLLMKCRATCDNDAVLTALGYARFAEIHAEISEWDAPVAAPREAVAEDHRRGFAAETGGWAMMLSDMRDADERIGALLDSWGVPKAADYMGLGIGYNPEDDRVYVIARGADELPAMAQGRALDPDAELRWKGLSNVGGTSWDITGRVGSVTGERAVLVTEGMSDAVVAAVTDQFDVYPVRGANNTTAAADALRPIVAGRTVYIAGDGDTAGEGFAAKLADELHGDVERVAVLTLPEGQDLKDVRGQYPDEFATVLADLAENAMTYAPPAPDLGPKLSMADALLGEHVAERHLRGKYVAWGKNAWSEWNGKRWEQCSDSTVFNAIRKVHVEIYRPEVERAKAEHTAALEIADAMEDTDKAELKRDGARKSLDKRLKELGALFTVGKITAVQRVARGILEVPTGAFDTDPHILNASNGVVDLRSGKLMAHDPAYMCARIAPTDYVPGARHDDWGKVLTALVPDTAEWMRARFGQAITGVPADDDIVPFLSGSGANSKSTLIDGITGALGGAQDSGYATQIPDKALLGSTNDHPTELMTFKGARFAYIEELPQGDYLNAQRLKKVAGTQAMTARYIGQDSVTWNATHSLMITTNYDVKVDAVDHGTWRRVAYVRFPFKFDGSDPERPKDAALRGRMRSGKAQHQAVLAWLVAAAVEWYAAGQELPAMPKDVREDTTAWKATANHAIRFFDEMLVPDPNAAVLSNEVFEEFQEWAKAHGMRSWGDQLFWSRFAAHDEVMTGNAAKTQSAVRTGPWQMSSNNTSVPDRARLVTGVRFADGRKVMKSQLPA